MKAVKITLAIGVLVAVALAAVWVARDRIIGRLTGPLLERHGWVITDVSLDALATRDASLGHIELMHEGGMVVTIEDLVLAVRESPAGRRVYRAGKVTLILPAERQEGDSDVAAAIRQVLGLPGVLGDVDVAVGTLEADGFPPVSDITWSTFERRQVLEAKIGDSRLSAEVLAVAVSEYAARLAFAAPGGEFQRVDVHILDAGDGVRLSTATEVQFGAWLDWLERAGLLPPGLGLEGGGARVDAVLDVPNGPGTQMALRSTLAPDAPWRVGFDGNLRVSAEITAPVDIVASLPDGEWSVGVDSADVDLDSSFARDIDVHMTSIACRSGILCTFGIAVTAEALRLGGAGAEAVDLTGRVGVEAGPHGAVVSATVQPGAVLKATGVNGNDISADRVEASFVSGTMIGKTAAGWQLGVDSIDMIVEGLVTGETRANASVFLERSSVESGEDGVVFRTGLYVPSVDATYGALALKLPGARGNMRLADRRIAAELQTVGLRQEGSLRVTSDFASGEGELRLAGAVNDLADHPLSTLLEGTWQGFDLTAGTLAIDAGFHWWPGRPSRGEATLRLANVAGLYAATAFTGVDTEVEFSYDERDGLAAEPAAITATFADIGIALRDLSARYRLWPEDQAVDVSELAMSAFGGKITTDSFRIESNGDETTILVHARSINLAEMLSIQDFEAVEVTGYVDADLPVALSEQGVRIADGRLSGLPPGGVIRYRKTEAPGDADTSALGFAAQALSNFEYETLSSDVSYAENGDLVLKMQIRGSNPDFENGRPIVLNLAVENNVRDMLRSLQATRSAQDVIERRMKR